MAMRKKEMDTGRQRRRKDTIYVDWKNMDWMYTAHTNSYQKQDRVGTAIDERGKREALK